MEALSFTLLFSLVESFCARSINLFSPSMMWQCVNASVVSRRHLPNTVSQLQAPGQDHQAPHGTSFTLHPWRHSQPTLWLLNILPGQTLHIPNHLDTLENCNSEATFFSSQLVRASNLQTTFTSDECKDPILSDLWPNMAQWDINGHQCRHVTSITITTWRRRWGWRDVQFRNHSKAAGSECTTALEEPIMQPSCWPPQSVEFFSSESSSMWGAYLSLWETAAMLDLPVQGVHQKQGMGTVVFKTPASSQELEQYEQNNIQKAHPKMQHHTWELAFKQWLPVPLHCLLPTKVRGCSIERYSLIQWDQTGIGWDKQCHVQWHPCQHAILLSSTTKFYILTLSLGILINTRIFPLEVLHYKSISPKISPHPILQYAKVIVMEIIFCIQHIIGCCLNKAWNTKACCSKWWNYYMVHQSHNK